MSHIYDDDIERDQPYEPEEGILLSYEPAMNTEIPDDSSDIGMDDFNALTGADERADWHANRKRTYDTYQHRDLEEIDRYRQRDLISIDRGQTEYDARQVQARDHAEALFQDSRVQLEQLRGVSFQALQNAVALANRVSNNVSTGDVFSDRSTVRHADNTIETSEMTGKRAMDTHDVGVYHDWDLATAATAAGDQGIQKTVQMDDANLKAIGAAVAGAVVDALSRMQSKA